MKIIRSINNLKKEINKIKLSNKSIGFVPTMGALHEGHLSLIRRSRRENDRVVVSIFVNPAQFGPKEDFRKYPRDLAKDSLLCRKSSVDIIFCPRADQMYPQGYKTYVNVEELSGNLCGKSRPGHFKGVATVVAKLFNLVGPDNAYFGQKDAQQAAIIRKMVSDLNMPVNVKVESTVREKDGLAMSSRNIYLNKNERKEALVLHQSLKLAKKLINSGIKDAKIIIRLMKQLIMAKKAARIDYVYIVDLDNLESIQRIKNKALIAVAVWIGKTRLIDNITVYG